MLSHFAHHSFLTRRYRKLCSAYPYKKEMFTFNSGCANVKIREKRSAFAMPDGRKGGEALMSGARPHAWHRAESTGVPDGKLFVIPMAARALHEAKRRKR